MAKGISLHIGLNYVDPDAYDGWDGALAGCVNDANDMKAVAASRNFSTTILTNAEATSAKVISEISNAAKALQGGDIFFISYSGHGGQIPDEEGNESVGFDETWVLYDREVIDNELYRLWSQFKTGVRIIVISDSCHSGTIVKMFLRNRRNQAAAKRTVPSGDLLDSPEANAVITELRARSESMLHNYPGSGSGSKSTKQTGPALRFIPFEVNMKDYMDRKDLYATVQNLCGSKAQNPIDANLILISGCQDNQYSYDGDDNGYFTGKLLQVWNNGAFGGNYRSFHEEILSHMPEYQTPNFMKLGPSNTDFEREKPFTIGTATASGCDDGDTAPAQDPSDPNPNVTGPNSWGRNSEAPTLSIYKGANPYYYVEIATDNFLFDYQANGGQRNANNFYATWNDSAVGNNGRLTQNTFQLPDAVWQKLRSKSRLYYRIGTTSSLTKWENFMITVANTAYASAPYISLVDNSGSQGGTPQSNPVVISKSVGNGGNNGKTDVKKVQQALNSVPSGEGGPSPKLTVDGLFGEKTGAAIKKFQSYHQVDTQSNGLIQPDSATLDKLGQYA
ncbi:MAG TPA: caspase family protein [Flavilitoribacter sp.]|nr:caspase family protein [Flavilitoribacter sp.]